MTPTVDVNQPSQTPYKKLTREAAVAALKSGARCCTRPSVRKARLKGVPGLK